MKTGRLKEIVSELQGASKMHLKQSKEIASHIDDMPSRKKSKKKNPCWKGYEAIGMKKKGGRTVPNCVPKKKKK